MKKLVRLGATLLAACAALVMGAASGVADPVKLGKGTVLLPLTGLVVDLKPLTGREYHVSGSWYADEAGETFDGHDLIDEIDLASGNVRAGTWVFVGYFDAGDCDAVLAGQALDNEWKQDAKFAGKDWKVRGGVYTFDNALGRRPAALMCRTDDDGLTLLVYRFLTMELDTLPQADVMADVSSSGAIREVSRSFTNLRTEDSKPTHRPEVQQHGGASPSRAIKLEVTGFELQLPDDGFFWVTNPNEEGHVDVLSRLAPVMPTVDLEIAFAPDADCEAVAAVFEKQAVVADHAAMNAPSGWMALPAVRLDDGKVELAVCHERSDGVALAGIFQGATNRDIGQLKPLLEALRDAKRS